MAKKKEKKTVSVLEAVEDLSSIVQLEAGAPKKEGVKALKWLDTKDEQKALDHVKGTFKTIKKYMEQISEQEKETLQDIETQKGLRAIMILAGEAAEKLDSYAPLFKKAKLKFSDLKEFKELQSFYLNNIVKRFEETLEKEAELKLLWEESEADIFDIKRRGLKDLETVRRDRDYELFFIRKEDKKPFFNKNLIRHIKLITDFDGVFIDLEGDDPLLKIQWIKDQEAQHLAQEIKKGVMPDLEIFFEEAFKHKSEGFVASVLHASLALLLSSNTRNLIQNTTGKSCSGYFKDFQNYLRQALSCSDYVYFLSNPPEEPFVEHMIELMHAFVFEIFTNFGERQSSLALVHRMVAKEKKRKAGPSLSSPLSMWNQLLEDHEKLETLLKKYPNGPLMKALDVFSAGEQTKGFDPFLLGNLPCFLFQLQLGTLDGVCLRLPSPTCQTIINKAEVNEEFKGLLRYLKKREAPYLLFNLQDRTTWEEFARADSLEALQRKNEFSDILTVISLPKNTAFYHQTENYLDMHEANLFLSTFQQQLESGESCGFYFPSFIKKELADFIPQALDFTHTAFFGSNESLSRKNRLDFIEIFYFLCLLKSLLVTKPMYFSFTCKDAIDTGVAETLLFFGFLKKLTGTAWMDGESDFLEWLAFSPALLNRERPIDLGRLSRSLSAISIVYAELEVSSKKIIKNLEALYGFPLLEKLRIDLKKNI